jgi:hypothetical protein
MSEIPQFNPESQESLGDEEKSRKRVEIARRVLREEKEKHAQMGKPYYQHDAKMDIDSALMAAMDWDEDQLTSEEFELIAEEFHELPRLEVRRPKYHYESQQLEELVELRSPVEQAEVKLKV